MLKEILEALKKGPAAPAGGEVKGNVKKIAAAALMVEAARLDREFGEAERATILRIVREHFGLGQSEAETLVDVAEKRQRRTYEDWIFTKTVREGFSPEECKDVVEMLWEVAYADGSLHRMEQHMIQRVAGDLGVDEAALEEARKAAAAKAGISE